MNRDSVGEVESDRSETTHAALSALVQRMKYRPGWRFGLVDHPDEGLRLEIVALGYDSYHVDRGETYRVIHAFIVPPATYNDSSWTRWLLDRLIEVETHECCEFFTVGGQRPFAPNHGPGWNPYGVRELNTAEAAETTFRGERREGTQR